MDKKFKILPWTFDRILNGFATFFDLPKKFAKIICPSSRWLRGHGVGVAIDYAEMISCSFVWLRGRFRLRVSFSGLDPDQKIILTDIQSSFPN